jgi:hypothetical protein
MRHITTTLAIGVLTLLIAGSATARDTKNGRLYKVDPDIVKALDKAKLPTTKLVREHFTGMKEDKVRRWAKARKLDPDAFVKVVVQTQVIGIKSIGPKHAWLLVDQCRIRGLASLARTLPGPTTACINERSTAGSVLSKPVEQAKVEAWMAEAKTFSADATEKVVWSQSVAIQSFFAPSIVVQRAMLKAKHKTNLDIFDALHMPRDRERFAKRHKLDLNDVKRYVGVADLLRLKAMKPNVAHLFWKAGYRSAVNIKGLPTATLRGKLEAANKEARILKEVPADKLLVELIQAARPLKSHP